MGSVDDNWCSPTPEEACCVFARTAVPWWFAGGWAIDLFLNTTSRAHADLDVGCFRADLPALLEQLRGWDIRVARAATDIVGRSVSGLPYVQPEIQLLYKAKHPRPQDVADFNATLPFLQAEARSWLLARLRATSLDHPWLALASDC